jgi:predicted secreted acid phosphatase
MKIHEHKLENPAITKLMSCLPRLGPLTVVFDIDDTVLQGEPQKVIGPMFQLYKFCLHQPNSRIYFITAREATTECLKHTISDLRKNGMGKYHGLFLRPPDDWNFAAFKSKIRSYIHHKYHRRINLNIGNQLSDLFTTAQITMYKEKLSKFKSTRFYIIETSLILRLKLPTLWGDKRRKRAKKGTLD